MMINNIDWPEWSSQTSIRLITKYIIPPKISNHQRVDKFYLSFEIFWHLKRVKRKSWLKYPKSSSTLQTIAGQIVSCIESDDWKLIWGWIKSVIIVWLTTGPVRCPHFRSRRDRKYEFNFEIRDRERYNGILHNFTQLEDFKIIHWGAGPLSWVEQSVCSAVSLACQFKTTWYLTPCLPWQ